MPDASFDFVYSWSAFEHVSKPLEMLQEIRRVVRPDGHFFFQLWPFYQSAYGSHLWDWFADEHHHLKEADSEIVAKLKSSDRHTPGWTEYMTREFEHLNRLTLDELQPHGHARHSKLMSEDHRAREFCCRAEDCRGESGLASSPPTADRVARHLLGQLFEASVTSQFSPLTGSVPPALPRRKCRPLLR